MNLQATYSAYGNPCIDYLSILLLQGIINKPTNDMYWSKDTFLLTPIFSRLVRRDRFEQIRKMINVIY